MQYNVSHFMKDLSYGFVLYHQTIIQKMLNPLTTEPEKHSSFIIETFAVHKHTQILGSKPLRSGELTINDCLLIFYVHIQVWVVMPVVLMILPNINIR